MSLIYQADTNASNNVIRLRNLIICEGATEEEALAKVQTYFDGSSPGFTFNDQYVKKPRWEGIPSGVRVSSRGSLGCLIPRRRSSGTTKLRCPSKLASTVASYTFKTERPSLGMV